MKFIAIIVLLVANVCVNAQYYWSNPRPAPRELFGIHFLDSLTGWTVGNFSTLLKTTDGGQSWSPHSIPIRSALRKVIFVDKDFGWIIGGEESTPSFGSVLLTTDGGETWSDHNIEESNAGWNDISVINKNLIYIGGFKGVYKSTDGGYNWIKKGGTNWTTTVFFIDSLVGWFGNTLGGVYKTTNGGDTWGMVADMHQTWHKSLKFFNSNIGYIASGGLYSEKGYIYKSTNGGVSWELKDSLENYKFKSIEIIDSLNIIVVGSKGIIKRTYDGGENWISDYTNVEDDFNAVVNHHGKTWIAGGSSFYGRIFISGSRGLIEKSQIYTNSCLNSVDFYDNQNGICVGLNGTILITKNSGQSWENLSLFSVDLSSVCYLNNSFISFAGRKGEFIKSTDGGNSWQISHPFSQYHETELKFFSEKTGYSLSKNATLSRTSSGGNNWYAISEYEVHDFFFIDSLCGWILTNPLETSYSMISNTTDGGQTWSSFEFQTYVDDIFFLNNNIGWLSSSNNLYKSIDGGSTWNLVKDNLGFKINQFLFCTEKRGYFLTEDFPNTSLTSVKYTNDGGESFFSIVDYNLLNYMKLIENKLWVAGEYGHILEVNVDQLTNIRDREEPMIGNYYLYQNYPNPFNPSTIIQYSLPKTQHVSLKVFNVLGQEIANLVDEVMGAGLNNANFNAVGLASGIYIYRLATGDYIKSKKLMLIK